MASGAGATEAEEGEIGTKMEGTEEEAEETITIEEVERNSHGIEAQNKSTLIN